MNMNISIAIGDIILAIILGVSLGLLLSLPVMWLWNNALVGAIDGVKEIGWLQAWGIHILCGFLFKTSLYKTKK